ncbi:MAG: hypothetical protein J7497_06090 [Chitinophagaceae bacterium]|nr:hypothetical protein [Chitinophagaceae bacterium]
MKKLVLFLLVGCIAASTFAQTVPPRQTKKQKKNERRARIDELARQEEEGEIVYNKQNVFSIKLATDGYGLGYEFGKFKANRKSILFNFEFSEKKHPKEKKEGKFDNSQLRVNYIAFGKTNTFYQTRFGAAMQQVIGGKGNKNGVSVSAIYGGGLTLGLVKPYEVEVLNNQNREVISTYPEIIDSGYYEIKAKGITGGWSGLKVRPGVYAKMAMRFDYGRLNETVTAIEVGLSGEYYGTGISQMVYNKDKSFFFNAYVALLLGRRK